MGVASGSAKWLKRRRQESGGSVGMDIDGGGIDAEPGLREKGVRQEFYDLATTRPSGLYSDR